MEMYTYKTGKMRDCAREISAQLNTYKTAKDAVDSMIEQLRNNWADDTNTQYARKYNAEAKVAAENVQGLMKQFVDVLTSTADALDKLHTEAQNNINAN